MNRLMKYSEIWHEQIDKEFKEEKVSSSQNGEGKVAVMENMSVHMEYNIKSLIVFSRSEGWL